MAGAVLTASARRVRWDDLPPAVQSRLEASGLTRSGFDARVTMLANDAVRRVHEGDMDHLVFYVLQSTHFTRQPPIEPALASREFVDWQNQDRRDGRLFPQSMEPRVDAFLKAVESTDRDARLGYFRQLLQGTPRKDRKATIAAQFARTLSFLYRQEFLSRGTTEVSKLYGVRGLSTDTAVEAGYSVYAGLGVLKGLEPGLHVRRVLIIGPGMDVAPRTGMTEEAPPESYQPWAVIDALLALGLSRIEDLHIYAADINPRVVQHLRQSSGPPLLTLVSGLKEGPSLRLSNDYRDYFAALGSHVGRIDGGAVAPGRLGKRIRVDTRVSSMLQAEPLDIVTERLEGEAFDLVIATNVLVYFQPLELTLALANIASILRPGGVLMHNEVRAGFADLAAGAGLTLEQTRQVVIATVTGAPPLVDTILLYRTKR